jgi:protein-tyrosine phosphatase
MVPNAFPDEFEYLYLNVADEQDVAITDYFAASHEFIDRAIKAGGNVLVHCEAGISRSPTIVISYLMVSTHQPLKACLDLIKRLKLNIGPNKYFFQQLIEFERTRYHTSGTFFSMLNSPSVVSAMMPSISCVNI